MSGVTRLLGGLAAACVASVALSAMAAADQSSSAAATTMRRLTDEQYRNAIADIFGEDIEYASRFDPLVRPPHGLQVQGVSQIAVSPAGFEQYDKMGRAIAAQVVDERHRDVLVGCKPANAAMPDDACAAAFYRRTGQIVFRRPLGGAEAQIYVDAAHESASLTKSFYRGLADGLGVMLASAQFLFDIDATEPDPDRPDARRLDAYSKASRISFFLWNTTPDHELLAAAAKGTLHTQAGLLQQVNRLLKSPRLEQGVRTFFADMFGFDQIPDLAKDPVIYPQFTREAKRDMPEQTLRTIVDLLLTNNGDYRDIFTTRHTFLTRSLGPIYQVPVPDKTGWIPYDFAEDSSRAGILSHMSFAATFSHPGRSSPTLRGKALRELVLCQVIPDPPPNVNFSLVENTKNGTVRERLTAHRSNPACAGCHRRMDPIGLSLENFDGIGMYRPEENGAVIDASGDLDGSAFTDPVSLGGAVRNHPQVPACLSQRMVEYAERRPLDKADASWVKSLTAAFAEHQYRIRDLMRAVATSEQFFRVPASSETSTREVQQ